MYDWIVFCDFNGTITVDEVFAGIVDRLQSPKAETTFHKVLEGSLSRSEGLRQMFAQVSSEKFHIIEQSADHLQLSYGFGEFLTYLSSQNVPVVVLSACPRPLVDRRLRPYQRLLAGSHSVEIDWTGDNMRLVPAYPGGRDGSLIDKELAMQWYASRRAICIGDSDNDLDMARGCDVVLAKKELAETLRGERPFYNWEDFADVLSLLKALGISNL